jgi:type II secretory pathway component GspD/PulD (secretin)
MKFWNAGVGVMAVLALAGPNMRAQAQDLPKSDKAEMSKVQIRGQLMPVQTIFLANASQPNDANELLNGIRQMLPSDVRLYVTPGQNSISVSGTPEEIAAAQKLIGELDRPKKSYRLTFTITESDAGKKIGVQHTSMVVTAGGRTTIKNGSKVPVATGSYNTAGAASQTQFTYLDVGINIDATLNEVAGGAQLKAKVEQSSATEDKEIAGIHEPVVRQSVMEGVSLLTMGKPEVLGALDISGSTRHLDIEVVMEPVK